MNSLSLKTPESIMLINAVGQIIEKVISEMAAGSHFEFGPLAKLAHTFARITLTNFLKEPSKITNPCINLCPDSTVTEVPDITQLLIFEIWRGTDTDDRHGNGNRRLSHCKCASLTTWAKLQWMSEISEWNIHTSSSNILFQLCKQPVMAVTTVLSRNFINSHHIIVKFVHTNCSFTIVIHLIVIIIFISWRNMTVTTKKHYTLRCSLSCMLWCASRTTCLVSLNYSQTQRRLNSKMPVQSTTYSRDMSSSRHNRVGSSSLTWECVLSMRMRCSWTWLFSSRMRLLR